jgi:hypothetical protein
MRGMRTDGRSLSSLKMFPMITISTTSSGWKSASISCGATGTALSHLWWASSLRRITMSNWRPLTEGKVSVWLI